MTMDIFVKTKKLGFVHSMPVCIWGNNIPDLFKLYMQLFVNLAINPDVSLGVERGAKSKI